VATAREAELERKLESLTQQVAALTRPQQPAPKDEVLYCWTHGVPFRKGSRHSSRDCKHPAISRTGNQYVHLFYSTDGNYIHLEASQSRKSAHMVDVYRRAVNFFDERRIRPQFFRMDNESSAALERYIEVEAKCRIQYVAPNNHRQNKAERCIQTAKNHFISMLASTDPTFPMDLWDLLLEQAKLTMNLMRSSSTNSKVSAWAYVHGGPYRFSETPIAPAGTAVLCYF
jgi:hypothetical protein